jgi:hypothetical protein
VTTSGNGSFTLLGDGSFDYTPNSGFAGVDSFSYQAHDGTILGNTVTVSLTVNAVSAGPNLSHGSLTSVVSSWQTVTLGNSYTSMVVVATPRYNTGSGPGVVRINNVTAIIECVKRRQTRRRRSRHNTGDRDDRIFGHRSDAKRVPT